MPERLFALSMLAVVPGVPVALFATAGLFTDRTTPLPDPGARSHSSCGISGALGNHTAKNMLPVRFSVAARPVTAESSQLANPPRRTSDSFGSSQPSLRRGSGCGTTKDICEQWLRLPPTVALCS